MAVTARATDLWRTAKVLRDDLAFFTVDFPVLAAVPEADADFLAAGLPVLPVFYSFFFENIY